MADWQWQRGEANTGWEIHSTECYSFLNDRRYRVASGLGMHDIGVMIDNTEIEVREGKSLATSWKYLVDKNDDAEKFHTLDLMSHSTDVISAVAIAKSGHFITKEKKLCGRVAWFSVEKRNNNLFQYGSVRFSVDFAKAATAAFGAGHQVVDLGTYLYRQENMYAVRVEAVAAGALPRAFVDTSVFRRSQDGSLTFQARSTQKNNRPNRWDHICVALKEQPTHAHVDLSTAPVQIFFEDTETNKEFAALMGNTELPKAWSGWAPAGSLVDMGTFQKAPQEADKQVDNSASEGGANHKPPERSRMIQAAASSIVSDDQDGDSDDEH